MPALHSPPMSRSNRPMGETPHFVLFSRIGSPLSKNGQQGSGVGRWHFVLKSTNSNERLEAGDVEENVTTERLELLAVVRGLEALEQPSRVTLMTPSRQITRGIREGIEQWKADGWTWERFGVHVPIKNADLWQRVDRGMQIHQVRCLRIRVDAPHLDRFTGSQGGSRLGQSHSGDRGVTTRKSASDGRPAARNLDRDVDFRSESASHAVAPRTSDQRGGWFQSRRQNYVHRVAGWLHHVADNLAGQVHPNL